MAQASYPSRALLGDVARRQLLFEAWLKRTQPAWDSRTARIPLTPKDHRYHR